MQTLTRHKLQHKFDPERVYLIRLNRLLPSSRLKFYSNLSNQYLYILENSRPRKSLDPFIERINNFLHRNTDSSRREGITNSQNRYQNTDWEADFSKQNLNPALFVMNRTLDLFPRAHIGCPLMKTSWSNAFIKTTPVAW